MGLAETSPSRVRRRGGEALERLGGTLGAAGRQPGDTGIPVLPSLEQGDTRPATPWGPKAGVGRPQPRRVRALPAGQRGGEGGRSPEASGDPAAPGPASPDVCAASRKTGTPRQGAVTGRWAAEQGTGAVETLGRGRRQTPLSLSGCLGPAPGGRRLAGLCGGGVGRSVGRSGPRLAGGHVWRRRADDLITGGLCPPPPARPDPRQGRDCREPLPSS